MAGSAQNQEVVNGLRLSEREEAELLAALSRVGSDTPGRERRRQERVPYQHQAGLIVKMHHPGGSIANYLVRVRNLSSGGIGFLHSSFVYSDTRCTMTLRTRDNKSVFIQGKVVRCKHVRMHIHEVGLRFDEPIKLGDFVASALKMGTEVETSKELPQLSGLVLYVEDSVSDQQLLAFHLSNVGVKVKAVSDVLAAVELASQVKFDAVLANVWLPAMSGLELAVFLRQNGYKGPVIAVSADDRPEVLEDAIKHGCTTTLIKPYNFEELFRVLQPFLTEANHKTEQSILMSELWSDDRMQPLIRSFLARLRGEITEMKRLVESGRGGVGLRKLCLDIKGSAGGYGYPTISKAAQAVLEVLMREGDPEQVKTALTGLAELCHAACTLLDETPGAGTENPSAESADTKAA